MPYDDELRQQIQEDVALDDDASKERWIKATLANDENSSDEELISYFMKEGGLSREEAQKWVSQRTKYLNNIRPDDD